GVIGEFALARQNFGPSVEERTRRHGNARPRATDRGVGGGGVDVLLFLGRGLDRRSGDCRRRDHRKAKPGRVKFHIHDASHSIPPDPSTSFVSASETAAGGAGRHSVGGCVKNPSIDYQGRSFMISTVGHKIFRKRPLPREKTTNEEGSPCSHVGMSSRRRAPDLRSPAPLSALGRSRRQPPLSICPRRYRRGCAATPCSMRCPARSR